MAALESAERAVRTLREVPGLFLAAGAFAVLKLPVEATHTLRISLDVYAGLALLTFLFTPVLLAGLYGVAARAMGAVGAASFRSAAVDRYLPLVAANAMYAVVQHLLMLVFSILAVVVYVVLAGGLGTMAEVSADPSRADQLYALASLTSLLGIVVVSVVYLALRAGVAFLMQLYKPSVTVGGNGPIEAFKESARLVRANVESTLGFVLVRYFAMVVFVLPAAVAILALSLVDASVADQLGSTTGLVVLAILLVAGFAVGVLALGFLATHRVAFYDALTESEAPTDAPAATGPASTTPVTGRPETRKTTRDRPTAGDGGGPASRSTERGDGSSPAGPPDR
jgi:hypothetical protein